ncbi:signal transducing adapter molecule 1-like isoform X2 [Dysidea avara]|uniref:signal transducing adapter molecule 1-like isoform X2 n=1 Tax=Dysidea avara TaxID=196820 RepID=UPI003324EC1C
MSYDRDVELATSSADGNNDWEKIISFCNRVTNSVGSTAMQLAISAIFRRIKNSSDYRIQLQAITLLESCAGNCGKLFQTELANQQSLAEIRSIITGSQYNSQVVARMKEVLASWTAEFQHEAVFTPIRQLYDTLRREGISFVIQPQPSSSTTQQSAGEDDIAKAIRLSLEEANKLSSKSSSSSMYPSLTASQPSKSTTTAPANKRHVRAIYDFDAAEDNELSFKAGEVIELIDDSDQNWWKGSTSLGTGLFPANFVSKNMQKEPEPVVKTTSDQKKKKQNKVVTVSLEKINLCLEMLKSADATDANQAESETTRELEEECQQMRPLVEKKLKDLEKKEEEMEEISKMFHEAIATYKKLLVESSYNAMSTASMTAQPTVDPASSNYGAQSYTTTDSSNQYMPPSYVPPSVYGQPSELPSMSARYSPELSRAQFPATGLQHQQPLPQAPPPPVSSTSVLLQPPAYQASTQMYMPPGTVNYAGMPSYQPPPVTQNMYTSTPPLF